VVFNWLCCVVTLCYKVVNGHLCGVYSKVATALVNRGQLKKGAVLVAGTGWAKVSTSIMVVV
jgi:translation initiation factor IF-2